jgi:hypothetical protein
MWKCTVAAKTRQTLWSQPGRIKNSATLRRFSFRHPSVQRPYNLTQTEREALQSPSSVRHQTAHIIVCWKKCNSSEYEIRWITPVSLLCWWCWLLEWRHKFRGITRRNPVSYNGSTAPWGPRPPHFSRLHDHTIFRHTTLGRTPLAEGPQRPLVDNIQHSQETDIHSLGGNRSHNPSKQAAEDPSLRPRCHWDWPRNITYTKY